MCGYFPVTPPSGHNSHPNTIKHQWAGSFKVHEQTLVVIFTDSYLLLKQLKPKFTGTNQIS